MIIVKNERDLAGMREACRLAAQVRDAVARQVAPGVAALAGGPLAGGVVKVLAENILGNPDASEEDLTQAMAGGLTPEMRQAILLSQQQLGLEAPQVA